MHENANAILAIWHDIEPSRREETLTWYDKQHHAERVDVPGFLSARRYMAIDGSPELFNRYETVDVRVLASEPYLERLNNPTDWSLRCQPTIINNIRTVCRIEGRAGRGEGGFVATLRLAAKGDSPALDVSAIDWSRLSARLTERPGILSAELWAADESFGGVRTREHELRGVPDRIAPVTVVVHGSRLEPLKAGVTEDVAECGLRDLAELEIGFYGLAFALDRTDFAAM